MSGAYYMNGITMERRRLQKEMRLAEARLERLRKSGHPRADEHRAYMDRVLRRMIAVLDEAETE